MKKILVCSIAILLMITVGWSQQNKPAPVLDQQIRKRLVENIIRELKANYVAPEKVKDIEAVLRTKFQNGDYDKLETPARFATAITQDLRTISNDLHLFVTYDPVLEKRLISHPPTLSVKLEELPPTTEQLAEMRASNFNFRKLEILRGNVGYLDLRSFMDLTYAKNTAVGAMSFLANSDAVIIDLRKNPGGYVNLNIFLASYFFGAKPVELLSRYHRDSNVTVKEFTLAKLPGKRMPDTPLYILTSSETGSAAERFAFIMQQRKRATLIGEKTSGAGYGNKEYPIGDGFVFYVSVFSNFDGRTKSDWQGKGIEPDINVPADKALGVAHLEAIKTLAAKATNETKKRQLSWLIPLLDFETNGAKKVSLTLLEKYAGKYKPEIIVALEGDQLYFTGASGNKRKLFALADDCFLIEDSSVPSENQARVKFFKNENGDISELQLVISDGRAFSRIRETK